MFIVWQYKYLLTPIKQHLTYDAILLYFRISDLYTHIIYITLNSIIMCCYYIVENDYIALTTLCL